MVTSRAAAAVAGDYDNDGALISSFFAHGIARSITTTATEVFQM